jgi:hypothetical protein
MGPFFGFGQPFEANDFQNLIHGNSGEDGNVPGAQKR